MVATEDVCQGQCPSVPYRKSAVCAALQTTCRYSNRKSLYWCLCLRLIVGSKVDDFYKVV